jgi:hypothetical protein
MNENHTTAIVQRYLDALAEETPTSIIRALLDRAVGRLGILCGSMLSGVLHPLLKATASGTFSRPVHSLPI